MFPGGRVGCESRAPAVAVTARASHGARPSAAPHCAAPPEARRSLWLRVPWRWGGERRAGWRGQGCVLLLVWGTGARSRLSGSSSRLSGWAGSSAVRDRWHGKVCCSFCSWLLSAAGASRRRRRKEVPGRWESDERGSPAVTAARASLRGSGVGGGRDNGERDG